MTPKEAAKQLIDRFIQLDSEVDSSYSNWLHDARKCALICVYEKLKSLNNFAMYWDLKRGEWYKDEHEKLQQVKQEINKL